MNVRAASLRDRPVIQFDNGSLALVVEELDPDTREVIAFLRGAVTVSGLSQAAFARALGTSAARLSTYLSGQTRPSAHFVFRARRIGEALGTAAARGLMSAPATAAAMRVQQRGGDADWTWRMLLQGRDDLAVILRDEEAGLAAGWEAEPASVGDAGWDALLAAVVTHEFEQAGRPPPDWATTAAALPEPWMPEHPFLDPERVRAQTPAWLSVRNIFVPARDLVTA